MVPSTLSYCAGLVGDPADCASPLTIPDGRTLTNEGTFIAQGGMTILGTLTNEGTFEGPYEWSTIRGTVVNSGSFTLGASLFVDASGTLRNEPAGRFYVPLPGVTNNGYICNLGTYSDFACTDAGYSAPCYTGTPIYVPSNYGESSC